MDMFILLSAHVTLNSWHTKYTSTLYSSTQESITGMQIDEADVIKEIMLNPL